MCSMTIPIRWVSLTSFPASSNKFKPGMHINYAEATWKVNDDLPKFADVPTELGGSGKMLDNAGNPIASP